MHIEPVLPLQLTVKVAELATSDVHIRCQQECCGELQSAAGTTVDSMLVEPEGQKYVMLALVATEAISKTLAIWVNLLSRGCNGMPCAAA